MTPDARNRLEAGQCATCDPGLHEPRQLAIRQMDRVRQHRLRAQAAGAVVDIHVVDGLGEEPGHLGDLAAILGDVGLPVRSGRGGQRRRLAQQLGRTRDGEPRRDRVLQPAVVAAVPALDEVRGLAQGLLEDVGRLDDRVVRAAIHHHLADDRPDPVLLGRPERGIQARLVDRAVHEGRRRAGAGERAPRDRGQRLGGGFVEVALEREDVALEPRQQVQSGAEAGVRDLGQMGVQVDHARQEHPGSKIDGRRRSVGSLGGRRRRR